MQFIPGLKLSELFYKEIIQPLMADKFPHLTYAAARLAWGSDVMGFDTPMSMDHGWGPKLTLFLSKTDWNQCHTSLDAFFANHLPFKFHGFPTHFGEPLADGGKLTLKESYPINHGITITTLEDFFLQHLGVDIQASLSPIVWLTIPQQRLRTLRSGRIFHDGLDQLSDLRGQFDWYPHDVWLYLMANQWRRIEQEEAFIGRTGVVGDALGTRQIASRLIMDLMRLCFLMEKQYAPYNKWFGSAFQQLKGAHELMPIFTETLNRSDWQDIQSQLSKAYILMANSHNALAITPHIQASVSPFYNRPFLVPHSARLVAALMSQIKDPAVQALPHHLGGIDQFADSTDLRDDLTRCQLLRILYQKDLNRQNS